MKEEGEPKCLRQKKNRNDFFLFLFCKFSQPFNFIATARSALHASILIIFISLLAVCFVLFLFFGINNQSEQFSCYEKLCQIFATERLSAPFLLNIKKKMKRQIQCSMLLMPRAHSYALPIDFNECLSNKFPNSAKRE